MIKSIAVGLAALLGALASPALAQSRLFSDEAPLEIVITAPFKELVRTAAKTPNPYPATLSVSEGAQAPQSFPLQVQARGVSRRTLGFCQFPPLFLDFDKTVTRETVFRGQGKLKLVTYCRDRDDYEQRILIEAVAYRLYNVLTPQSFRVRMAKVTYKTDAKDAGVARHGFLIEDMEDVAKRNGLKEIKLQTHQITPAQLDARAAGRVALFEYMISNVDYDFVAAAPGRDCCHNIRAMAAKDATAGPLGGVVPAPYDFDHSGIVDAPYAVPQEVLKLRDVTQRLYRGYCATNGEIPALIEEFRGKRAAIMAVIAGDPRLTEAFRAKAAKFVDGFYEVINDPARVESQIVKRCRPGRGG
jgi:hypothetical protein